MSGKINLVNTTQVAFYLVRGVEPVRYYADNDKLIFEYNAEDTKKVWEEWKQHCIDRKSKLN